MDIMIWILAYWTVASFIIFLILKVDYPTFKSHPWIPIGLLTYFGPFGWLLITIHSSRFVKEKLITIKT